MRAAIDRYFTNPDPKQFDVAYVQEENKKLKQHPPRQRQTQRHVQPLQDLFGSVRSQLTGGHAGSPLPQSKSETFSQTNRKANSQSPRKVCFLTFIE